MKQDKPTIAPIFEVAEDYRPLGVPIMTGVKPFDTAMDRGMRDGELITLSGLTASGKTSYALWLTKQIVDSGVPCLWFTYEMNPWYLREKLLALGVKDEKYATYVPIEHSKNTDEWIKSRILDAQKRYACKIVFIDHLHYLIPPDQEKNTSLMIGGIVRKLKSLAVETNSIIFLIAHMRRLQVGEGVNIDAIRDSALIANESDYVFLIERLKKKKGKLEEASLDDNTNYSRVALAKNRRTGTMFSKIFQVDNNNFIMQTDEQIEIKKLKSTLAL